MYAWFTAHAYICVFVSLPRVRICVFVYVVPVSHQSSVPRQRPQSSSNPCKWRCTLTFGQSYFSVTTSAMVVGTDATLLYAHTHTTRYLHCLRMKRIWRLYLCLEFWCCVTDIRTHVYSHRTFTRPFVVPLALRSPLQTRTFAFRNPERMAQGYVRHICHMN